MANKAKAQRRSMTAGEMVKRFLVMLFGLIVTALGLAICVRPDLGISPITTLPYALSHVVPALSLGTFVSLQHLVFFILTVLLLRRDFKPFQILQLPCAFVFGYFVDLWGLLLEAFTPSAYWARILMLLAGCVVVALGFSFIFTSGVALEANTAFLNALALRTGKPYGTLKIISDIVIVLLAAAVSLIFLHQIVGIREGTILAALLVGYIAGFFNRRLVWLERFFTPKAQSEP